MRLVWLVFGLGLLSLAAADAQTQTRTFKARLSPLPIDVATMNAITGGGTVTATLDGDKLTITGTFEQLQSPATLARVHRAYRGTKGPPFAELTVTSGTSGTISGTLTLTPEQASDLWKSLFYVQLHSEKAADGNLWGWLLPVAEKKK